MQRLQQCQRGTYWCHTHLLLVLACAEPMYLTSQLQHRAMIRSASMCSINNRSKFSCAKWVAARHWRSSQGWHCAQSTSSPQPPACCWIAPSSPMTDCSDPGFSWAALKAFCTATGTAGAGGTGGGGCNHTRMSRCHEMLIDGWCQSGYNRWGSAGKCSR